MIKKSVLKVVAGSFVGGLGDFGSFLVLVLTGIWTDK